MKLSKELESLGFRLSLGAAEVDEFLTEGELAVLETIAARYATRRTITKMIGDGESTNPGIDTGL